MRFRVVPEIDESGKATGGFVVNWIGAPGKANIAEISGFATHQDAQAFISDTLVRFAKAVFAPSGAH